MAASLEQLEENFTPDALTDYELARDIAGLSERYLPLLYGRGVERTRLEVIDCIPDLAGYESFVKDEGQQPTYSYKLRGAIAAVDNAQQEAAARSQELDYVVCASNGNFAMGVTFAAAAAGLKGAVVETSSKSSPAKRAMLRETGAVVHYWHPDFASARKAAVNAGSFYGQAFIDPYDAKSTMAGQGSMAQEISNDVQAEHLNDKDEATVLVPMGGGGMAGGMGSVFHEMRQAGLLPKNFRMVGVQMENCDALSRILNGEERLTAEKLDASCDSTALLEPGNLTRKILQNKDFLQGTLTVTKAEVAEAMLLLEGVYGLTEPAGALAFAGSLKLARLQGKPSDGHRHLLIALRSGGANLSQETFDSFTAAVNDEGYQHIQEVDHRRKVVVFRQLSAAHLQREVYGIDEVLAASPSTTTLERLGTVCLHGMTQRLYVSPIPRKSRS